jgi:hypothetical protein
MIVFSNTTGSDVIEHVTVVSHFRHFVHRRLGARLVVGLRLSRHLLVFPVVYTMPEVKNVLLKLRTTSRITALAVFLISV